MLLNRYTQLIRQFSSKASVLQPINFKYSSVKTDTSGKNAESYMHPEILEPKIKPERFSASIGERKEDGTTRTNDRYESKPRTNDRYERKPRTVDWQERKPRTDDGQERKPSRTNDWQERKRRPDRQENMNEFGKRRHNFSDRRIKYSHDLSQPTSSNIYIQEDQEVIYGIFPVILALQSCRRKMYKLYYKENLSPENTHFNKIMELCKKNEIPVECITKYELKNLTRQGNVTQGVCLVTSPLAFEAANNCDKNVRNQLWLFLDQVTDPMNFGSILRTAYFLGVNKMLVGPSNCCPLTATVSKASAGVAEIYPVYQCESPAEYIASLKENDWNVVCSVASKEGHEVELNKYARTGNTLLIIGSEGHGASQNLQELADTQLTIASNREGTPEVESLNVSVATSVIIYTLTNKIFG